MSLGVEPRLIDKNKLLTYIGHTIQDIIVSLLEEGRLIPLAWNGGDGLPGHVKRLQHFLDGTWRNLNVVVLLDMLCKFLECCAGVVLEQQKNRSNHIGSQL